MRLSPIMFLYALILAAASLLAACTVSDDQKTAEPASSAAERVLTLYNWEDYLGENTLERFTKRTGIMVTLVEFKDEEAILAALQSGDDKADVVIVSGTVAKELYAARLLADIDFDAIPNFRHVPEEYRNMHFDPEQRYSVPYLKGSIGLVVNTRLIPDGYDTWKVLWDKRYAGKLAMLDNSLDVIDATARMLGFEMATSDHAELQAIENALQQQKPLLVGYLDPLAIRDGMINETLWAAQVYSGDGIAITEDNPDVAYVVPQEGTSLWLDVLVTPRFAPHPQEAYAFINFLHQPEIMADIAQYQWYAPTNAAAMELLDPELLAEKGVFPPPDVLSRSSFVLYEDDPAAMNHRIRIWNELTGTQ